jgi:hypothetical protein
VFVKLPLPLAATASALAGSVGASVPVTQLLLRLISCWQASRG